MQPILRVVELHRRGELGKAESLCRSILATRPNDFDAMHLLGLLHYQQGRNAEALRQILAALKVRPKDFAALSNLGLVYAQMRQLTDALASYDQALALKPDYVDALVNRGNALRDLGRLEEALASFDKALALKRDRVDALINRGNALRDLRRPDEALASYEKALALNPRNAVTQNNRGVALADLRRFEEALAAYDRALALRPDYADALNNRGNALKELKRAGEALVCYDRALALRPDYVEALNNRGVVLRDFKRREEALASYDKALALKPDYAEGHNNRGNVLRDLRRLDEARASYDRALASSPDYAAAHDNLGVLLAELGRFSEAISSFERAIELAPRRARAYYNLAIADRMTRDDPRLRAMEALALDEAALTKDERIDLHFALGKALADTGDHERSFRNLLAGNALRREQTNYDEAATLAVLRRTRAVFAGEWMRARSGLGELSPAPLFIVGMPRSGTTLIEQILASHPLVYGAGEIDAFDRALRALRRPAGGALNSPEAALHISDEQWRRLGADYVARLRTASPAAERIVNKTLENFRLIGLIHLALPNARIVHVRRGALDTCLSCFSQLFVDDLPYTYDLAELGRYHRAYESTMAHWREALPQGVMLDVQYEEVVADLEGEARRIVAHCGLEWDARCLDFHRNERPVHTASVAQVRQPIYKSSIGRWRAYETFLQPLLSELRVDEFD